MKYSILIILFGLISSPAFSAKQKKIVPQNIEYRKDGTDLIISFLLRVDKVASSDYKLLIKPELINDDETRNLRYVLIETRRSKIIDKRNGIADSDFSINGQFNKEFIYNAVLPYEKWMDGASLYFNTSLIGCCSVETDSYAVVTSLDLPEDKPVDSEPHVAIVAPEKTYPVIRQIKGTAYIVFRQGSSALISDYRNNKAELEKIKNSLDDVERMPGAQIVEIQLQGTCSPEGTFNYNTRLANERVTRVRDYLINHFDVSAQLLSVTSVPEDWQGLRQIIQNSDIQEKQSVLSAIDSDLLPDEKERELTSMPVYNYLLNKVYPLLRKVDYTILYEVKELKLNSDNSGDK